MLRRSVSLLVSVLAASAWSNLEPFKPTTAEIRELYRQSAGLRGLVDGKIQQLRLEPNWVGDEHFWYRKETAPQKAEHVLVTSRTGQEAPLFDAKALAKALSGELDRIVGSDNLRLRELSVDQGLEFVRFSFADKDWVWSRSENKFIKESIPRQRPGGQGERQDRESRQNLPTNKLRVEEGKVQTARRNSDNWRDLLDEEGFVTIVDSPDRQHAVAIKVNPGDRKEVFTIRTNDADSTRGILETRRYDQPGDKLDTAEYWMIDLRTLDTTKIDHPPLLCGGYPWSSPPRPRWWKPEGVDEWTFTLARELRGFQQYQVLRGYTKSQKWDVMIDEKSDTFVYTSAIGVKYLQQFDAALWLSERDGWMHIYWIDGETGNARQITDGDWVVRDIVHVDEDAEEIIFTANGEQPGDPYFIHTYSVKFDGSGFKQLTYGEGNHSSNWSPGRKYFVNSYSQVHTAPVHQLISRDGQLIKELARVDDSAIDEAGLIRPEVFSAKGRDGETDIWGIIYRPTHFDENKTYPVVEAIYAGPHDSHVPKSFFPVFRNQEMAELGFIVVQIDGMGTANRGKKFHDVCWQNLKDAGFPDRIAWMQEAAKQFPQMDLSRVGIEGTSAGGQNSTGALLFHPEFYKVAVSSCGCHDNRMDKYWWNEQWMGYPVGDHYSASSNIDNAHLLQGKLMLIIGEVDSNVPPESTFKLADALIKARKDFDLVHLPGVNHTGGGPHGERKRRDFFIKHLLGVEPPDWNVEVED